jgi:hypothetical protein
MKAKHTLPSFSYLLIGSGRVAQHLSHYLHLLDISFQSWDRAQDPHALKPKISDATHVLLAISDSAVLGFFRRNLAGMDKVVVHFSGAHNFEDMISAHPLMTFGPQLYSLDFYKKIHFTLTNGTFRQALPGLENPHSSLSPDQKPLYHASCVLGGNFTTLLIKKMLENLQEMNLPQEAAEIYISQIIKNTFANPENALTGPIVRKDIETVKANIKALEEDKKSPRADEIYKSFVNTYWPEYSRK